MSGDSRQAEFHAWLCDPLDTQVRSALLRLRETEDVRHIAVMPDVHLARDVCVGTVVATRHRLFPQAVGGDIGCGMAAVGFDGAAAALRDERVAARIMAGLYERAPLMRRRRLRPTPDEPFDDALSHPRLSKLAGRERRLQLGTLGRGNHFLEFQADDQDRLWLMLHTGSRAMGQAITEHHLRESTRASTGLRFLDADTAAGQCYLRDVEWAIRYARANRRILLDAAAGLIEDILGYQVVASSYIECNHNHVRREECPGEILYVHRKGAMPAALDEPGIIPGSMGTQSFHVSGRGCDRALRSSSHGAGRAMSRHAARKTVTARDLERQMGSVWFDHRAADGLREEAPAAYKDIRAVMRAQRELIRVTRRLRPLLCYKAAG